MTPNHLPLTGVMERTGLTLVELVNAVHNGDFPPGVPLVVTGIAAMVGQPQMMLVWPEDKVEDWMRAHGWPL
jgi:hypothetical protein